MLGSAWESLTTLANITIHTILGGSRVLHSYKVSPEGSTGQVEGGTLEAAREVKKEVASILDDLHAKQVAEIGISVGKGGFSVEVQLSRRLPESVVKKVPRKLKGVPIIYTRASHGAIPFLS